MSFSTSLGLSDPFGLDRLPPEVRTDMLFRRSLSEARNWCDTKVQMSEPTWSLRTMSLRPKLVLGDVFPAFSWDYESNLSEDIEVLAAQRAALLRQEHSASASSAPQPKGRILVFYFRETLSCGGAWQVTSGYFDDWNMPPWDTWVASANLKDGECLLSWVPEHFVDTVSAGIWANPEECLCWLRSDDQKEARSQRPALVPWPTRQ